jgi:6-phosphogluconolactonase (cycloisomerase 2 family)
MRRILLLSVLLLGSTIIMNGKAIVKGNSTNDLTMVIGTYTGGGSKGIYTYRLDQNTGKAIPLSSVSVSNPSYLIPSSNGKFIYAVSEMPDSTAALTAYALNKSNGHLKRINRQLTHGEDPCYVSTNGHEVLTANYTGGSMSVFPIREDGGLGPVAIQFYGHLGGPDTTRQNKPHIHCVRFSPDGKYLFATDFSADQILRFHLPGGKIIPQLLDHPVAVDANSGPRHLIFSRDGKFAYLISELSGNVTVFRYTDGNLTRLQVVTADTHHARGSADIHISPDGKFLYASNRLKNDGIAIFSRNPENGLLTRIGYQRTGIHPRNFNITPNGRFLLVACRDSNEIQIYTRNPHTGLLTDTRQKILLSKPVCVQFVK